LDKILDWSRVIDEAERFVVGRGGIKADLPKILGIRSQFISDLKSGKSKNPGSDFALSLINKMDFNPRWVQTGEGPVFLAETGDSPEVPTEGENIMANRGIIINKPSPHSVAQVGISNRVTMCPPTPASAPEEISRTEQAMTVFEIPLLTKEQVLRFDSDREIPDPKAHSGNYPDYTLVPMPRRFQDYSTDLRAMVVFNGLMAPLLAPGDIAIFQATGWNGDGVYVYRTNGDLHINHVRLAEGRYFLTREAKPSEEIPCDAETFGAIGRVRAVVREI
jgi:hypothetical protein